jgi:hypothetical protein
VFSLTRSPIFTSEMLAQEERQAEIYRLDNRFDPRTARRLVRAWLSNGDERYPASAPRTASESSDDKATWTSIGSTWTTLTSWLVFSFDNRFDPRTARRLVRAWLSNGDERYLPGQFVRTRVPGLRPFTIAVRSP